VGLFSPFFTDVLAFFFFRWRDLLATKGHDGTWGFIFPLVSYEGTWAFSPLALYS
jgi:hypothetical protein